MGDRWRAVAALVDRSRRALYDYVRRQDHPVSREEAADAARISRNLAAFHLDKLVDVGLLRARYEAPPDQPRGRGRAPKVYEPAGGDVVVAIPQRRYELIAGILADAVAAEPADAMRAATRLAHERGRALGGELRVADADLETVLAGLGFEPERDAGTVLLHNCPFHALVAHQPELVCGLNHAFVCGIVEGLGTAGFDARLVPRPNACCVELAQAPDDATDDAPDGAPGTAGNSSPD